MTFIITLISLVIERFFNWNHLRNWSWFNKYQRVMSTRIANWPSFVLIIICVLPWILIVGVINHLLGGMIHGVLQIIFGILILLYCMGPYNLWAQAFASLAEFNNEDPNVAIEKARTAFHMADPTDPQDFHKNLTGAIFVEANHRIFAIVFWFALLGPVGAVLYRTIALCAEQSDLGLTQTAMTCQRWLDWIPARVFTFLFALGGHFMEVFRLWKQDAAKGTSLNEKLLSECGIAALDVRESNKLPEDGYAEKSALELLDRALVIWLVVLAVIVLMAK